MRLIVYRGALLALLVGVALAVVGCKDANPGKAAKSTEKKSDKPESGHNYKGRDWCVEHGMPESICVQCNSSLAKKYKDKGDWCAEHDLPKSQCFQCDPKLKDKFAQEYRDKYGEDPPPLEKE